MFRGMPRRTAPGGLVYHVLNRAVSGLTLFEAPPDYRAFDRILAEACNRLAMRIFAYCLMPNHWHLVLQPYEDGDLSTYMHWVTLTHVMRWRLDRENLGRGHVYQGPFKAFAVKCDDHFFTLCRYVERNARSARLVERAEHWRWCSLWRRLHPEVTDGLPPLHEWPLPPPPDWIDLVNRPQTEKELDTLRRSMQRGCPFGPARWQKTTAQRLGLEYTLRARGRPRQ